MAKDLRQQIVFLTTQVSNLYCKMQQLLKNSGGGIMSLENELISVGNIDVDVNDVTVNSVVAKISNIIYTINTPTTFLIPFAAPGYERIDYIILTEDGNLEIITGTEFIGIVIPPTKPNNSLLVTELNIDDSIIDDTDPILGTAYLKNDVSTYSSASIPLSSTDKILIEQGAGFKKTTIEEISKATLSGDLVLPGYTSARNDGSNPNNKVLNVDASGNLKLYDMPVMPPPYLEELIPDSYMPSTTGNFIVKGSFFTPTTTVTVQGQTFNYKTFLNDNEILINLTTNAVEGYYDVTIDNGISVVFPDALLIVSGDVYKPTESDWENITGAIDLSQGDSPRVSIQDAGGSANTKSSFFQLPATGDFIVQFNFKGSPFDILPQDSYNFTDGLSLIDSTTLVEKYGIKTVDLFSLPGKVFIGVFENNSRTGYYVSQTFSETNDGLSLANYTFSIKRIGTTVNFYKNNILQHTASFNYAFPMKLKVNIKELDQENIKIIIPF